MTPEAALTRIREAFGQGRYSVHSHAQRRMRERHASLFEIKHAVQQATGIAPWAERSPVTDPPTTSWRVVGPDLDGDDLTVGIDLVVDHLGGFTIVITVF